MDGQVLPQGDKVNTKARCPKPDVPQSLRSERGGCPLNKFGVNPISFARLDTGEILESTLSDRDPHPTKLVWSSSTCQQFEQW